MACRLYFRSFLVKAQPVWLKWVTRKERLHWRLREERGISSGEVKFLDIRRNTKSESTFLAHDLTLRREGVGSEAD